MSSVNASCLGAIMMLSCDLRAARRVRERVRERASAWWWGGALLGRVHMYMRRAKPSCC